MRAFFDASAFAKRYIDEPGTEQVEALCLRSSDLAVSVICLTEIISALCRLRQDRLLTRYRYDQIKDALLNDLTGAAICNITPSVVGRSIRILETNPLRAMDALHIGCALEWGADVFVSSDHHQISAAKRVGLRAIGV